MPEVAERADHDMLEGSDLALEQLVDDGVDEPAEASIHVRDQAAVDASFHDDDSIRDEIVVDGVTIRPDPALRVMRQACENLGVGRSGGKVKVYKRLTEHLKRVALLEEDQAAANISEMQRKCQW